MVHLSQYQSFIALMYSVVRVGWPIVKKDIKNLLNNRKKIKYLEETWNDLNAIEPILEYSDEIKQVLKETEIKTAMCRGDPVTNMRTFDYSAVEGDPKSKSKPVPKFLIVVGGNMLSRGLTIEGLTVSWYTRSSKTTVADTIIQHQRWFGWRHGYIDLVRVFMQERHMFHFKEAYDSEQNLRNVFRQIALNNWAPSRHSAVLQEPRQGKLTNKVKFNMESIKLKKFIELRSPALELDAAKAALECTLKFWRDLPNPQQNHAGKVVLNVPLRDVLAYLNTLESVGMPCASDLIGQFEFYQNVCEDFNLDSLVNVGVPTRSKVNEEDFREFKDIDSQYIIANRIGLHKRKRNPNNTNEFVQLLGGKSQKSNREKHQYIDGVTDETSDLPEWLTTKDTENVEIAMPDGRGPDSPVLLLIYFLHPRFRGKGEQNYAIDAPEAGRVPLIALVGCFPDRRTRYVANKTVSDRHYVYPSTDRDEERPRKRAKTTHSQTQLIFNSPGNK